MFTGNCRYHPLSESLLYKFRDQTDADKFSDKCFAICYFYYLYMKLRTNLTQITLYPFLWELAVGNFCIHILEMNELEQQGTVLLEMTSF